MTRLRLIAAGIGLVGVIADQVTSVAREVGVEGRLGGQANVPGAAGTWKKRKVRKKGIKRKK